MISNDWIADDQLALTAHCLGQRRPHHRGTGRFQRAHGRAEHALDLRHRGPAGTRAASAMRAPASAAGAERRARGPRIAASKRIRSGDLARHRSGRIPARRDRHDSVGRIAAHGRAQAADAAERGRHAYRAQRVLADGQRRDARRPPPRPTRRCCRRECASRRRGCGRRRRSCCCWSSRVTSPSGSSCRAAARPCQQLAYQRRVVAGPEISQRAGARKWSASDAC